MRVYVFLKMALFFSFQLVDICFKLYFCGDDFGGSHMSDYIASEREGGDTEDRRESQNRECVVGERERDRDIV